MKKSKKLTLIWCLLVFSSTVYAQQVPLFNQYYNQTALAYPSSSLLSERPQLSLLHRGQWAGAFGAPQTFALSYVNPLSDKFGYNINANKFELGLLKRDYFGVGVSKAEQFNEHKIALGAEVGMSMFSLNQSRLSIENLNDVLISNLLGNNGSAINVNISISYQFESFSAHFLMPNVIQESLSNEAYIQLNRNNETDYLMGLSYSFSIDRLEQLILTPNFTLRYQTIVGAAFDLNGKLDIKDKFQLTAGYRQNYGSTFGLGVKVKPNILFSYNYDFGKSDVPFISNGFNEIGIHFMFSTKKEKSRVRSKRANDIIQKFRRDDIYDRKLISAEEQDIVLSYLATLESGKTKQRQAQSEVALDVILEQIKEDGLVRMKAEADKRKEAQVLVQSKIEEAAQLEEQSRLKAIAKEEDESNKASVQSATATTEFENKKELTVDDFVGDYILVVNAYKTESVWAKRYLASLSNNYPDAGIFTSKKRGYDYVYVLSFRDFNEAVQRMKELRKQKAFADSWVHVVRLSNN